MEESVKWSHNLRRYHTSLSHDFEKAETRFEIRQLAERLSNEKDRYESPSILQHLYMSNNISKTYEQLEEEHKEKLEKLKERFGATADLPTFNPFLVNSFQDKDSDDEDDNGYHLMFTSTNYRYSQRLTNALEKGKGKRLRTLPSKAYQNHILWSTKSISLEENLRLLMLANDLCLEKLMITFDHFHSGLPICLMDTLWPTQSISNNNNGEVSFLGKDCIGRLSNFTESMLRFDLSLNKETYRQVEFDALVLTIINDFNQLQKQLRGGGGKNNSSTRSTVEKEGDGKIEGGLLIALTADNFIHTRPLCTSADLSLALYELMDPKIFSAGFVQLPQLLPYQYERHQDGFYRFNFRTPYVNSTWQYVKCSLPSNIRDLKPYVSGIYFSDDKQQSSTILNSKPLNAKIQKGGSCSLYFTVEELESSALPEQLIGLGHQLCLALSQAWNHSEVLISASIDIEACREMEDFKKKGYIIAPHLSTGDDRSRYAYRVKHIHSFQTQKRAATGRRKAIFGLDGFSLRYLRDFHRFYHDEMASLMQLRERESEDLSNATTVQTSATEWARRNYLAQIEEEGDSNSDADSSRRSSTVGSSSEGEEKSSDRRDSWSTQASRRRASKPIGIETVHSLDAPLETTNEEEQRERTHRRSLLLLDKHRKYLQKEALRQNKRAKINSGDVSRIGTAETNNNNSSQSKPQSRMVSRRSRRNLSTKELDELFKEQLVSAMNQYVDDYNNLNDNTTNQHKLCVLNPTLHYLENKRAIKQLLRKRSTSLLEEQNVSHVEPVGMIRSVDISQDEILKDQPFFKDLSLEERISNFVKETDLTTLFKSDDVANQIKDATLPADQNGEEGDHSPTANSKKSQRSPRWYQENENENQQAYNELLDAIGGNVAARMREYDRLQRMKEYVRRRRNLQFVSMEQVKGLHILHHFQKPPTYSSSSSEEDEEEEKAKKEQEEQAQLAHLLGDYANAEIVQEQLNERVVEEDVEKKKPARRATIFRPKTADTVPVSPELYRRLSMRASVRRASLSEGSPRRDSKVSIRRSRNSIFVSVNNVLFDGRIIQDIAKVRAEDSVASEDDLQWERMTDSLSTILSKADIEEDSKSEMVILPQVAEEAQRISSASPTSAGGGRFWGLNKETVLELSEALNTSSENQEARADSRSSASSSSSSSEKQEENQCTAVVDVRETKAVYSSDLPSQDIIDHGEEITGAEGSAPQANGEVGTESSLVREPGHDEVLTTPLVQEEAQRISSVSTTRPTSVEARIEQEESRYSSRCLSIDEGEKQVGSQREEISIQGMPEVNALLSAVEGKLVLSRDSAADINEEVDVGLSLSRGRSTENKMPHAKEEKRPVSSMSMKHSTSIGGSEACSEERADSRCSSANTSEKVEENLCVVLDDVPETMAANVNRPCESLSQQDIGPSEKVAESPGNSVPQVNEGVSVESSSLFAECRRADSEVEMANDQLTQAVLSSENIISSAIDDEFNLPTRNEQDISIIHDQIMSEPQPQRKVVFSDEIIQPETNRPASVSSHVIHDPDYDDRSPNEYQYAEQIQILLDTSTKDHEILPKLLDEVHVSLSSLQGDENKTISADQTESESPVQDIFSLLEEVKLASSFAPSENHDPLMAGRPSNRSKVINPTAENNLKFLLSKGERKQYINPVATKKNNKQSKSIIETKNSTPAPPPVIVKLGVKGKAYENQRRSPSPEANMTHHNESGRSHSTSTLEIPDINQLHSRMNRRTFDTSVDLATPYEGSAKRVISSRSPSPDLLLCSEQKDILAQSIVVKRKPKYLQVVKHMVVRKQHQSQSDDDDDDSISTDEKLLQASLCSSEGDHLSINLPSFAFEPRRRSIEERYEDSQLIFDDALPMTPPHGDPMQDQSMRLNSGFDLFAEKSMDSVSKELEKLESTQVSGILSLPSQEQLVSNNPSITLGVENKSLQELNIEDQVELTQYEPREEGNEEDEEKAVKSVKSYTGPLQKPSFKPSMLSPNQRNRKLRPQRKPSFTIPKDNLDPIVVYSSDEEGAPAILKPPSAVQMSPSVSSPAYIRKFPVLVPSNNLSIRSTKLDDSRSSSFHLSQIGGKVLQF